MGAKNREHLSVLDLCTGSGCVALAIAEKLRDARVYGVDISEKAVRYAVLNADRNSIENAFFYCGDLFSPLREAPSFDLIVSNPPYIKSDHIRGLQPEIREWEPIHALDGGKDGLDYYRRIVPFACRMLHQSGILMLELGDGCAQPVIEMYHNAGFSDADIINDYAGKERIILSQKNSDERIMRG